MQKNLILLALTTALGCVASPVHFGFVIESTTYFRTMASPQPKERQASIGGSIVIDPANQRWMIRFPSMGNAEEIHICDGTNVVKYTVVLHHDGAVLEHFAGPRVADLPKDGGPVMMVVTPGFHPIDHYFANLAWMAWCSGPFLKIPGRVIPTVVNPIREDLAAFGFSDRTQTFSDALGLPKLLELFVSHERMKASPLSVTVGREIPNPARTEAAFARKFRIRDGSVHSRLVTVNSKEVDGVALTSEFRFEAFESRQDEQQVTNVVAHGRIVGEVTTGDFVLPEAVRSHQNFGVVDHRFRHERKSVDYIQYAQSGYEVRESSDAQLVALYNGKLSKASLDPVLQVKQRIYGMLGLGLGLPVIAVVFWLGKRR
jgi:hypothetical protein